jgi:hypothetical protein
MPPLFRCVAYRAETVVIGVAITILPDRPIERQWPSRCGTEREIRLAHGFGCDRTESSAVANGDGGYYFRPPDRFKDRVLRAG